VSDDAVLWMNLGDARRWAPGQRAAAVTAYQHAIDRGRAALKVNPRDALAHAVIASSLAKLGRSAEAAPEIDAALKLDVTNPDVLYQAAIVTLLRHDREGAAAWLRSAIKAGYSEKLAARDPELADLR
jgi:Flp pilus assembly protein TadD